MPFGANAPLLKKKPPAIARAAAEALESRTLLSLAPLGPEFHVNTYLPSTQNNPAIAVDNDGDFVIAWQSIQENPGGSGIYAQRYNTSGAPQGGEIHVNTSTASTDDDPAIAMDADGDFVIVWHSTDAATGGVLAQRFNAAGIPQGGEMRLTSAGGRPSVAMDAAGNFVVAWQAFEAGSNINILAQRYNAAGAPQGSLLHVNTYLNSLQQSPAIAMDASGDFVITWDSYLQDGSDYGVYAQRYNAAGTPQGAEFRVATTTTGTQRAPVIDMDADGDFVIAWSSYVPGAADNGVHAQRFNASAAPQGAEFRAGSTPAIGQGAPTVALDADGDFVISWQSAQDGSGSGIYAQRYSAAGAPIDGEFRVNTFTTNNQTSPAIAAEDTGEFIVAWVSSAQEGSGNGDGVFAQRYGQPALSATPDRLVNNNAGAFGDDGFTQTSPVILAFGNEILVAFHDTGSAANGSRKQTGFSRSTDGGATFIDGGTLPTEPDGDHGIPMMARDSSSGDIYLITSTDNLSRFQMLRSNNGGATWLAPINAAPGQTHIELGYSITVDNFPGAGRGNVYVLASNSNINSQGTFFFRSSGGGNIFTPVGGTLITTANTFNSAFVTVGPDHTIYVFWRESQRMMMRRSIDLGVTFEPALAILNNLGPLPTGSLGLVGIRNGTTEPAAIDATDFPQPIVNPLNGNLYLVYPDNPPGNDKADIFLVQSTDRGATWSAPIRINDDDTFTDQWQPSIAITPDGAHLGIFYYSRQDDPAGNNMFRYYGRIANISGATTTFAPSFPISDVASLPEFDRDANSLSKMGPGFIGLHSTAAATDNAFHVVWSDNRNDLTLAGSAPRKDPNVYYDQIPIVTLPAVTASAFIYETTPQRLTFTFDRDISSSVASAVLQVQRLTPTTATIPTSQPIWNASTNTVTFNFTGILPDGDYRATLDVAGAHHILNFFFLQGDLNHDRSVTISDFIDLSSNFNTPVTLWSKGDLNYDGTVTISDFIDLAANFNKSLGTPPPAIAPEAAASAEILQTSDAIEFKSKDHKPVRHKSHHRRRPPALLGHRD